MEVKDKEIYFLFATKNFKHYWEHQFLKDVDGYTTSFKRPFEHGLKGYFAFNPMNRTRFNGYMEDQSKLFKENSDFSPDSVVYNYGEFHRFLLSLSFSIYAALGSNPEAKFTLSDGTELGMPQFKYRPYLIGKCLGACQGTEAPVAIFDNFGYPLISVAADVLKEILAQGRLQTNRCMREVDRFIKCYWLRDTIS